MRKVVHPTDFSSCAEEAQALAVRLARALGAELILLHVAVETPPFREGLMRARELERLFEEQRAWIRQALEERAADCRGQGVPTRARVVGGAPHQGIVDTAKQEGTGFIVMGTHGRGALRALLHRKRGGQGHPDRALRGRDGARDRRNDGSGFSRPAGLQRGHSAREVALARRPAPVASRDCAVTGGRGRWSEPQPRFEGSSWRHPGLLASSGRSARPRRRRPVFPPPGRGVGETTRCPVPGTARLRTGPPF